MKAVDESIITCFQVGQLQVSRSIGKVSDDMISVEHGDPNGLDFLIQPMALVVCT